MSAAASPSDHAGTLYVVATPIGNLGDLSERARTTLASVDVVIAEDTRVTAGLLTHCGLRKSMRSMHAHNEARVTVETIDALRSGQSIALVTDAGTPAIADPGARLVRAAHDAGIRVVPIPGPNAAVAALSAAGFEGAFLFVGFLPEKSSARRKQLAALADRTETLMFYEAPHRIVESIGDLLEVLGAERRIVIARELTKLFESIRSMPLGDAPAWLSADPHHTRGEFVLVIEGAHAKVHDDEHDALLRALLSELPLSRAVSLAAKITGVGRNLLYARALVLSGSAE